MDKTTGKSNSETVAKEWRVGSLVYTTPALIALFFWLLGGDFAWAMKDRALSPAAQLLLREFGGSDFVFSLIIIAFPNFTNIFLCPIISYISDRHRGRLGRRIPFLLFTMPFIVIGSAGLGIAPMLGRWLSGLVGAELLSTNIACVIFFGFFWAIHDFGGTMAGALSGALVNDVVPQELLGRFFGLFRAVSLLAGMIFNFFILGLVEACYLLVFPCIGLLYGAGLTMLCWKVREGTYPSPPELPPEMSCSQRIFSPVFTYFRQNFSLPYYRLVIVALVLTSLGWAPINMYSILYAKSLHIDMSLYGKTIAVAFGCSFLLSYCLGALSDRFHPLRTTMTAMFCYFCVAIAGALFVSGTKSFITILFLHTLLSGCCLTLSASLPLKLFPKSLFAQFNSAFAMILALMNTLLAPLFGKILDCTGKNYTLVFIFSGTLTLLSLVFLFLVYLRFVKLGGCTAYVPPEPR